MDTDKPEFEREPFRQYARKATKFSQLRPYVPGESLEGISVSDEDAPGSHPADMIARNPENHADRWFMSGAYFEANFEPNPVD